MRWFVQSTWSRPIAEKKNEIDCSKEIGDPGFAIADPQNSKVREAMTKTVDFE